MEGLSLLLKYFSLTEKQQEQFSQLRDLYTDWNSKINVISRSDIEHLYTRHILHSMAIAKVIQFKDKTLIADIGTGGGFPGIPLAIFFPECRFHLVDSIGKKIKVVEEIKNAVGLGNITCFNTRAENLKDKYDFIVSRAVTELSTFNSWVKGKFKKENRNDLLNGILYLKGGDLTEELKPFKKHSVVEISDLFEEDFFETKKVVYLPGS